MILKETLREIVQLQTKELDIIPTGIERKLLNNLSFDDSFVKILSGIRRCGKSTLLHQIINNVNHYYYFNFEDPRAINFELSDFDKLDQVFQEEFGDCDFYFFDEIQNIPDWERFVRRKQDLGKKIFITGSNASLLSKELGDRLTGRHLTYELFPFSYEESSIFFNENKTTDSIKLYLENGGFPEFLKLKNKQVLHQLVRDVITRDIITRHQIRDHKILLEMAIYLITNSGNEFSYTRLKNQFGFGSVNTVISYISYLEDSYILFTVPKFSFSYTKQRASSKKIYSIDTGLSVANTASMSPDFGRLLENLVFLHLRRNFKDIYYYRNHSECDFLIKEQTQISHAIQVCYHLDEYNIEREIKGLKEAMQMTNAKNGCIVTLDQKDEYDEISIIPVLDFITKSFTH